MKTSYYWREKNAHNWRGPFNTYGEVVRNSIAEALEIDEVDVRHGYMPETTKEQDEKMRKDLLG